MFRPACIAVFVLTALLAGSLLPMHSGAQIQNPIQAAKDAYNKAKQQAKQQQQQQQQTKPQAGQQNPAQPASSSSGGTQDAAAPWTPPADNAPSGQAVNQTVTLDPANLPDIVGVHLGMTAQEAVTVLRKTYPADIYQQMTVGFWPGAPKPDYGYNVVSRGPGNSKDMSLSFTAPPGPQIVWAVARETQHMHINKATLLAALREKYGKETVAYTTSQSGFAAKNDAQIGELVWLYDEHGARVPLPPSTAFRNTNAGVQECLDSGGVGEPVMPKDDDWVKSYDEWCAHHLVALQVVLGGSDIIEYTVTSMKDVPLAVRTGHAASIWLHEYAQRQHQDDLERSKAKKPVL